MSVGCIISCFFYLWLEINDAEETVALHYLINSMYGRISCSFLTIFCVVSQTASKFVLVLMRRLWRSSVCASFVTWSRVSLIVASCWRELLDQLPRVLLWKCRVVFLVCQSSSMQLLLLLLFRFDLVLVRCMIVEWDSCWMYHCMFRYLCQCK